MKSSEHIATNFKTMKKSIIGKYDKIKASGMIWTSRKKQLFINFDLSAIEMEFTTNLTKNWNQNNPISSSIYEYCLYEKQNNVQSSKKEEEMIIDELYDNISSKQNDFEDLKPVVFDEKPDSFYDLSIDQLYLQAEKISKRISSLVIRANQFEKACNDSICPKITSIIDEINELKKQRRNIWENIEEKESKENYLMKQEKVTNNEKKLKKEDKNSNELIKPVHQISDGIIKSIGDKCCQKSSDINDNFKDKGIKEKYHFCLSPNSCQDKNYENNFNELKISFDDPKQNFIYDKIKNIFNFNKDQNKENIFNLSSNELKVISKMIDQKDINLELKEKELSFIGMDLCYLIPGMCQEGLTVVIFFKQFENENSQALVIKSIERRMKYLKENCNIVAEKIIGSQSDIAETSSIFTRLVKNEIKFLYLTNESIESNPKLIGILNVLKSKNNLSRIVMIFNFEKNDNDLDMKTDSKIDNQGILKTIDFIANAMKEIPILIITNELANGFTDRILIPAENIISEQNSILMSLSNDQNISPESKIRNNLYLEVMEKKSSLLTKNLEDICNWLIKNHYLNGLNKNNENHIDGSGIIFCLTNRDAESINAWLNKNGLSAAFFHSKMNELQQKEVIINWNTDGIKIVVIANNSLANNAELSNGNFEACLYQPFTFKKDVRFVIHYTMPQSIPEYILQANIAGQDGYISHSLLMFNEIDIKIIQRMITISPNNNTDSQKHVTQGDELKEIISYCTINDFVKNGNNCRRVQILKHFGIKYQYQNCYCMCDQCEKLSVIEEIKHDTTVHGINMLNIIKMLNNVEHRKSVFPTLNNVIYIYNGTKHIIKKNDCNKEKINYYNYKCAPEFTGNKIVILKKTIKVLCDRGILKTVTKKVAHGNIKYFKLEKNEEIIDEPIFV